MTPEQRFFPPRDNDELRVHDDFLAAHGDDPRGEVLREIIAPAVQDIGNAHKAVHGKNDCLVAPDAAPSFQTWRFFASVLCATLVHALILGAVGTWLGTGNEGSGGPMLMALELSGGGGGSGTRNGGQANTPPGAAVAGTSVSEGAHQAPKTSAPTTTQSLKNSPSPVPAAKKPEPKPLAKASAKPSPPKKALPERVAPMDPPPGPEPAKTDAQETASEDHAQLPENAGQGTSTPAGGLSDTAGAHSGVARQPQGSDSGHGAPGNGAAGADGGGGTAGGFGTGGNLIRFNSPGGPGIVRMTQPRYPQEARRLGKEGVVVLKLSLDETGSVFDVEVLQGGGFGMAEASREAVMLSRFRPATVKGRPVACQAILPIHFKLR